LISHGWLSHSWTTPGKPYQITKSLSRVTNTRRGSGVRVWYIIFYVHIYFIYFYVSYYDRWWVSLCMHPSLMTFVSSCLECLAVQYRLGRIYILSMKALIWLPHFSMILCILMELYDILIISSNSVIKLTLSSLNHYTLPH
jgi:hypothetical protein